MTELPNSTRWQLWIVAFGFFMQSLSLLFSLGIMCPLEYIYAYVCLSVCVCVCVRTCNMQLLFLLISI